MSKSTQVNKLNVFLTSMNILVWSIIFGAATYFSKAQPQKLTVLDVRYEKDIRDTWIMEFVTISLWLFVLAAVLCIVGLIINLGFIGNKKIKISKGLLLGLFVSLFASAAYILNLL
jgi:hypothetical protein